MPISRSLLALGLTLASLGLGACADNSPTQPQTPAPDVTTSAFRHAPGTRTALLTNIPVVDTLAGGQILNGLLSITHFSYQNGQLLASGTLTGTVTSAAGSVLGTTNTIFTDVPATLVDPAQCSVLTLNLGAINLDLLGLVVDLAPVNLLVNAVPGPGNLLGNLLCAVTNLLNTGGPLSAVNNLLGTVNNVLSGLLGGL